jgi:hypothetical protein
MTARNFGCRPFAMVDGPGQAPLSRRLGNPFAATVCAALWLFGADQWALVSSVPTWHPGPCCRARSESIVKAVKVSSMPSPLVLPSSGLCCSPSSPKSRISRVGFPESLSSMASAAPTRLRRQVELVGRTCWPVVKMLRYSRRAVRGKGDRAWPRKPFPSVVSPYPSIAQLNHESTRSFDFQEATVTRRSGSLKCQVPRHSTYAAPWHIQLERSQRQARLRFDDPLVLPSWTIRKQDGGHPQYFDSFRHLNTRLWPWASVPFVRHRWCHLFGLRLWHPDIVLLVIDAKG